MFKIDKSTYFFFSLSIINVKTNGNLADYLAPSFFAANRMQSYENNNKSK